ncbi:MAG: hypothetical protein OEY06_09660 [Gammaproteobacteria bacterium]|nr:hypothetical protein [Gammaproteobacteria bacterium]
MNNNETKIPLYVIGIITAVIAIIVTWILISVLGSIVGVIVGLIVASVVYMVLNHFNKTEEASEIIEEPVSLSDASIESLLNINIALRKEIIPEEIRSLYESIIDQLIDVLPKVNSEVSGGELAWVINRMATEYLPEKSIKPYLSMDDVQRNAEDTIASVKESIAGMQSELSEVQDILSSHKTDEFNNKAKFLKARFKM